MFKINIPYIANPSSTHITNKLYATKLPQNNFKKFKIAGQKTQNKVLQSKTRPLPSFCNNYPPETKCADLFQSHWEIVANRWK